ncbi:acetylcholine receptor subunit beta-like isoform X1 [Mya arenaria]|uniref:acetylcholine receptor subunit beta-like isoform X1 n=1 Tax=Mya arenaria TaxID=6604 RepID=UPI0022E02081|nr:acetylcholine receptor subunit beta-like isoform X1 [Mya arenaria]
MWEMFTIIAGLVLVTAQVVRGMSPSYSTDLETELRTALFTGYEVLQRPAKQVPVTVSMNLITVNSLDIKAQTLSTSGFFEISWPDDRLVWGSDTNYSNIPFLFSTETYAWTPKVVIENSVNDLEVFSDVNTLIRLNALGTARWTPGGVFETSCEADITYYPLDTQTCSIVLTTWSYTSSEISLSFDDDPFILDNFSENGEWELIETSNTSESAGRSKSESFTYDRLYFTMKLRRRPLYHILNTIFPVILMSCLIVFVFKLPPESGERIGMSLTVLLAYAVYLTLITDNIPQTSLSASVLSTYLTIILMLSTLSVIFTIVVLDIYFNHDDDEAPTDWLQKFTKYFLVKITCWKGGACCRQGKVKPSNVSDSRIALVDLDKVIDDNIDRYSPGRKVALPEDDDDNDEKNKKPEERHYSWKEVALILDRFFMYLFVFLVVTVTVVCLSILAVGGQQ